MYARIRSHPFFCSGSICVIFVLLVKKISNKVYFFCEVFFNITEDTCTHNIFYGIDFPELYFFFYILFYFI